MRDESKTDLTLSCTLLAEKFKWKLVLYSDELWILKKTPKLSHYNSSFRLTVNKSYMSYNYFQQVQSHGSA